MNNQLQASPLSVVLTFILVVVTLMISYKEQLKLEKEIMIAVFRMTIQLAIVGFLLQWIFDFKQIWMTVLLVLFMNINAAWNASKRGKGLKHSFRNALIAINISSFIALAVMVGSGTLTFIPDQIIPVNGMIIGTTMTTVGMVFNNMRRIMKDRQQQIIEMLALGANAKQASHEVIKVVLNASLQPTIDSLKMTGLVTLPGLMAGLIFAGVSPVKAILYQIVIMFMMLSSAAIGSYVIAYLTYPNFYTDRFELNDNL